MVEYLKKQLLNKQFEKRNSANLALLAFDLGRAKNEVERENARKEWEFRFWAFELEKGLKESLKLVRKYEKLNKRSMLGKI